MLSSYFVLVFLKKCHCQSTFKVHSLKTIFWPSFVNINKMNNMYIKRSNGLRYSTTPWQIGSKVNKHVQYKASLKIFMPFITKTVWNSFQQNKLILYSVPFFKSIAPKVINYILQNIMVLSAKKVGQSYYFHKKIRIYL